MLPEQMHSSSLGGREGEREGWGGERWGEGVEETEERNHSRAEQSRALLVLPDILCSGTFSLKVY